MKNHIETERLILRALKPGDAAPVARLISNWDVVRWLTSPPYPYRLADAEWFIGDAASNGSFAVVIRAPDGQPDAASRGGFGADMRDKPFPGGDGDRHGGVGRGGKVDVDDAVDGNSAGPVVGVIGLTTDLDLGYWLGQPYHGNGIMTEAVMAVLADHFAFSQAPLTSGYLLGNEPSKKVLTRAGFQDTGVKTEFSRPMGRDVQVQRMELTAEKWNDRCAP